MCTEACQPVSGILDYSFFINSLVIHIGEVEMVILQTVLNSEGKKCCSKGNIRLTAAWGNTSSSSGDRSVADIGENGLPTLSVVSSPDELIAIFWKINKFLKVLFIF